MDHVIDDGDDVAEAEDFNTTNGRTRMVATIGNDSTDDAMTMASITSSFDADLEDDTVYVFRVAAVSQDAA